MYIYRSYYKNKLGGPFFWTTLYITYIYMLGWMCPLKPEQARRERESELRLVNSL